MKVVVPFLTLLLAGLSQGPVCAMADDESAAAAAAATAEAPLGKEMKPLPGHMRPHDNRPVKSPIMPAPIVGGKMDVTGSNDQDLAEVSEFAAGILEEENSELTYVQFKAEVQVVAGMIHTLTYKGNGVDGVCKEERILVIYHRAWLKETVLKSDTTTACT